MSLKLIKLGTDRRGEPVYLAEFGSYNVIIVVAKPRYGKSVLVKNMYTQIADSRPVVIFDYQGEHSNSKFGNWRSKDKISFIPDLYTVDDYGFYMSDFDQMSDWVSMGFGVKTAPILMELLEYSNVHNDNPYIMLELLRDLPARDNMIDAFNKKYAEYGLERRDRIHDGVKQSLIASMASAVFSGLLIPPVGSQEHSDMCPDKRHIDDWGAFVEKHKHLNIDLNIVSTGSVMLARAGVGKILDQMVRVLYRIKPLIVVEEADFLVPNTDNTENITSLDQFRRYVLKHQRTGVELMFISQDPNLLDQYTLLGGTLWIMGQHTASMATASVLNEPDTDYVKDIIHQLKFDRLRNKREFAFMVSGDGGRYKIFEVDDAATLLE